MKKNDGHTNLQFAAYILLFSLVFSAAAIAQEHPRLYFSASDVQTLRAQAAASHSAIYQQIKAYADNQLKTTPPAQLTDQSAIRLAGDRLIAYAFTYVISGDSRYATLAKNYLLKYAGWKLWDTAPDSRDLGLAHMLLGNALAFDWIYDTLSSGERSTIAGALAKNAQKMYEASTATSNVSGWNNWWNNSYLQNHAIIDKSALGVAGLALLGHDSHAQSYIDEAAAAWERITPLLNGGADGSWHEGTFYGAYAIGRALPFLLNLRRVQGRDLLPHQYLKAYSTWRAYNYLPNTIEMIMPGGDFEYSWSDISSPAILRFAAREYRDGLAQWVADRIIAARGRYSNDYQAPEAVLEFLGYDAGVGASAPNSLAKAKVFKNLEGLVWRTGWGSSDIVFGFKTGAYGGRYGFDTWTKKEFPWSPRPSTGTSTQLNVGHDHDDMNGFYLYANGSWLAPEADVYSGAATSYHNSLLIDGKGQLRPQDANWNIYPQDGSKSDGTLDSVAGTPGFDYLSADATRRYSGISEYRRIVLFVRPSYFVILDNLQASAAHSYDFVNHFQNSVAIEGKWVKGSGANGQVLGVNMVAPASVKTSTGNDGRPWVRIRPAANVASTRLINLLFPTTSTAWSKKPTVSLAADSGSAAAIDVSMNDGSGRSDAILIAYKKLGSASTIGTYSFDGTSAVISRSGSAITTLFVSGGTSLADAKLGVTLASGMSAAKTYEFGFSTSKVSATKKNKNKKQDAVEETIRLYAPGVTSVTVNGLATSFVRDGEYVIVGPAATITKAPEAVSVSPSAGSGTSATFSVIFRDADGATDISSGSLLINTSTAASSALYVTYNRSEKKLYLRNDNDSAWTSGPVGGSGTLSNSQGSIALADVKAAVSGTDIVLTVPVDFSDSFSGMKNVYLLVEDSKGLRAGWTQRGSFSVSATQKKNAAPSLVSLSPNSGSGASATFSATWRDADGNADLESLYLLVHTSIADANCARLLYRHDQKRIYLLNDAGTAWSDAKVGGSGTLSNSQVSLDVAKVSVSASGTDVTVRFPLSFTSSFAGGKNVYMAAKDLSGEWASWSAMGTWTVPAPANTAPQNISVSPTSGSGGSQTFTLTWRDADGASDMESLYFLLDTRINDISTVRIMYRADQDRVYFLNDAGDAWTWAVPGDEKTLSNGQGSIDMAKVSVSHTSTDVTLTLPLSFKAAFNGDKKLWMNGKDKQGNWGVWESKGTWTVNAANAAPAGVKASASDDGADTVLEFTWIDRDGATDIRAAHALIGAAPTAENACYLRYERDGQLSLRTADGSAWITGTVGEAASLRNDQLSIDLSRARVSMNENSLTLRLAVRFNGRVSGTNTWLWAADGAGAESGWRDVARLPLQNPVALQPRRQAANEFSAGDLFSVGSATAVKAFWTVNGQNFGGLERNIVLERDGFFDISGREQLRDGRASIERETVLVGERLVRAADSLTWNAGEAISIAPVADGVIRLRGAFAPGFRLVLDNSGNGPARALELRESGWVLTRGNQVRRLGMDAGNIGARLLEIASAADGTLSICIDGQTLAHGLYAPAANLTLQADTALDIILSQRLD